MFSKLAGAFNEASTSVSTAARAGSSAGHPRLIGLLVLRVLHAEHVAQFGDEELRIGTLGGTAGLPLGKKGLDEGGLHAVKMRKEGIGPFLPWCTMPAR
jgi:hypothetical protein